MEKDTVPILEARRINTRQDMQLIKN